MDVPWLLRSLSRWRVGNWRKRELPGRSSQLPSFFPSYTATWQLGYAEFLPSLPVPGLSHRAISWIVLARLTGSYPSRSSGSPPFKSTDTFSKFSSSDATLTLQAPWAESSGTKAYQHPMARVVGFQEIA
ncbi:hypothetical protein B0H65DRAFT_444747 [Neurospora tetraspora]|uniref:Uncharacterized protein n=1 Tax=Neurospora tetraspora TaxID=94610 RepID=A0AAE0JBC6_9PEZI|nr:hypothetical protein B0H65DRAFT_444747 [Neurospora tetraspora]